MSNPVSFDAPLTAEAVTRTSADRPYALWALVILLIATACTVLVLDASITPEQRIAVFEQSRFFP